MKTSEKIANLKTLLEDRSDSWLVIHEIHTDLSKQSVKMSKELIKFNLSEWVFDKIVAKRKRYYPWGKEDWEYRLIESFPDIAA